MITLGREKITVQPRKQTLTDGIFVMSNDGAASYVWGSVQPIGQAMLDRLPEGARRSARWVIFAEPSTAAIDMGPPPDILITSKGTLIPVGEADYTSHTSGLPHVAYACAEVGADE